MKLYLLSQTVQRGYDTYDSCVVAAETEEKAKQIHPDGGSLSFHEKDYPRTFHGTWAEKASDVKAIYLGEEGYIDENIPNYPVICASFNAG